MASPNDCGLRVASINLKVGLRTVITKFGKFGLCTIATLFKLGEFGHCATPTLLLDEKFGLRTTDAKYKFSGSGPKFGPSLAAKFGLQVDCSPSPGQVASFEFGLSMAFSSN